MALGALAGLEVVIVHPPVSRKRTWRERLFSRPWRPLKAYETTEHPMWNLLNSDNRTCYRAGNRLYVSTTQFETMEQHFKTAIPAVRQDVHAPPPVFRW